MGEVLYGVQWGCCVVLHWPWAKYSNSIVATDVPPLQDVHLVLCINYDNAIRYTSTFIYISIRLQHVELLYVPDGVVLIVVFHLVGFRTCYRPLPAKPIDRRDDTAQDGSLTRRSIA
jgi:hypothetical protein